VKAAAAVGPCSTYARSIRPRALAALSVSKTGVCDHVVSCRLNTAAGEAFRANTDAAIFLALDSPVRSTGCMPANLCSRGAGRGWDFRR
jgi:hypothetical protein